jgi:hypothetical protein
MRAWAVLSEVLSVTIPILDDGTGPEEDYAIAQIVVAESRSKAIWMAWKTDKDSYNGDARDMPRFRAKMVPGEFDGPSRVIDPFDIGYDAYSSLWSSVEIDQPVGKVN